MVNPGVEFKVVECHALAADRDLGEMRADLRVEAIAVHAEVAWRVTQTEQPGRQCERTKVIANHGVEDVVSQAAAEGELRIRRCADQPG